MLSSASEDGFRTMLDGVRLKTLVHGDRTLLTEVRIARGAVVPPHRHPHEQTGYLVSGALRFTVEGVDSDAHPGDSWNIGADVEHGAVGLEDTVLVEVFSPPREDYLP